MDRRVLSKELDLSALLPDDVLAHVLGRLAKRSLAVSRCVCKKWHAVVDAHPLLRAQLLPRSLAGILINFRGLDITEFFSRPSTDPSISRKHDYLPDANTRSWSLVRDHCNGLLLLDGYVLNPATRRWSLLPEAPAPRMGTNSFEVGYLVYDPVVSRHCEVLLIPLFDYRRDHGDLFDRSYRDQLDPIVEQSEWPPSPCILHVLSSKTERWEERTFVREGEASGTVAYMRSDSPNMERNAVYWQGALYVHCQTDFIMRISLSDDKFQVIIPPASIKVKKHPKLYLGKSENGVYCALVYKQCSLRVWFLSELEWVLKYDVDFSDELTKQNLGPAIVYKEYKQIDRGPWILQEINYYYNGYGEDNSIEAIMEEKCFEWDSGDEKLESSSNNENAGQRHYQGYYIDILAFHPFKEIIFLSDTTERGLAYHLNSSKIEDLGDVYPTGYHRDQPFITSSFPYTPCWM